MGGGDVGPPFSALLRQRRGIPVVVVCGEIDLSTVVLLREAFGRAVARAEQAPCVVADLSGVSFMDVVGLRNLIWQGSALRELGGDLWLVVNREGAVTRLLELTGLDEVLRVYPDCDSVVENIEKGA